MFDGLKTMDKLVSDEKQELLSTWKEKLEKWKETAKNDDVKSSTK